MGVGQDGFTPLESACVCQSNHRSIPRVSQSLLRAVWLLLAGLAPSLLLLADLRLGAVGVRFEPFHRNPSEWVAASNTLPP